MLTVTIEEVGSDYVILLLSDMDSQIADQYRVRLHLSDLRQLKEAVKEFEGRIT